MLSYVISGTAILIHWSEPIQGLLMSETSSVMNTLFIHDTIFWHINFKVRAEMHDYKSVLKQVSDLAYVKY